MSGQIVHFEIPADDTGKAREFWGGLFGWQFEAYPGPSEYHMTASATAPAAPSPTWSPASGARAHTSTSTRSMPGSPASRSSAARPSERMPVPNMGWFSVCKDPHGNEFGIWQTDESASMPE